MDYMPKLYHLNTLCLIISIHCHVHGDMKYRVFINNIWLYHMSIGFMLCIEGDDCNDVLTMEYGFSVTLMATSWCI